MNMLELLKQIPAPILILIALTVVLMILIVVIGYRYAKAKGLDGIRKQVYQLILKAEHMYKTSGTGKQKMKWVVSEARKLLPTWLQYIFTEELLEIIIEEWFKGIKDLLDDGKVNQSQRE